MRDEVGRKEERRWKERERERERERESTSCCCKVYSHISQERGSREYQCKCVLAQQCYAENNSHTY